jgi:hypothetical protein
MQCHRRPGRLALNNSMDREIGRAVSNASGIGHSTSMTMYYAHTVAEGNQEYWEPLSRHLREVAELAAMFGARLGLGDLVGAAGLLHDLGKYSADFQARLRGSGQRVDHSTAGAVWAFAKLGDKPGRLLARGEGFLPRSGTT